MDAKDLRAEATLTERSSDGGAKFVLQYDRSNGRDAGASAFKGDAAGARPCAVIGPDRVVPPARDCPKKPPAEPWLDPVYRRLSDYPHKMSDHKDPTRNISPRQTFQENMQRIIMPPGYNAIKMHEDPPYASKNNKLNVPLEVKYCEVPYNINPISSDQKHIRNADHSASNVNPLLMRGVPHGWPASSVNVRPLRPYGAPEVLQYPEYANCTGPRPVLTRTHSSGQEDFQQLYADPYYHESNIRFKPYPNIKERYPQPRYEYIGNYPNPYHLPHSYAHKYELPKTMPPHTYSGYPPVPKYTERVSEPVMDGYQRAFSQQGNYSVPIRNPVIHPPYRPVPGAQMQNKLHPYPPDGQHKSPVPNKLSYDPSTKMYLDYDIRSKPLPVTDNYYLNELPRPYHGKNTIVLPNYAPASMHNPHPYYIKENMAMKNYEYAHYKNMDPSMINHSLTKLPPQFSPSTLAISPADSNASNETAQTHGTSQEDCGYVSQSSVASVRSIESLNRIPMDQYGRYDYRYGPVVRNSTTSKPDPNSNQESKSKKDIRQFISSWSEGDDENTDSSVKRDGSKTIPDNKHTFSKQYEAVNNQEQLYVLGLVNVPSEELSKYEHIQKVSKLPENIKGYNSLELLNQFEEAIESSNITNVKPPTPRAIQMPLKNMPHKPDPIPRAVSPLDVEAKISQSVIHKDVGCNFEIKPCSPKMLNVEVATPMQTLLNERVIEKVANPHNIKSPILLQSMDKNIDSTLLNKSIKCPIPNTASSCKMINSQHISESSAIDHLKTNYSLQDLESNSGVCLASLPRLDTDIELNFPEVNQQFINANKTESVITASFSKDLPTLDVDRSGNTLKNTIPGSEYDMNYQFSPKMETETDFSRLSKYRKLKRIVPDDNNTELAKAQATRVDSVIIKNPDNTRSLEENNDTSGYYRNDFQEFAMNLVSQVKNSKANHQHEIDKMFSTSTSNTNTSKYDEIGINSPSNSLTYKCSNLINEPLNEVEETSNAVHVQSEDLSMHSKDLSDRCLEKGTLDIPMNLSPKLKCSAIGLEEEIQNNKSDDVIKHQDANLNVKHQFDVENIYHKHNSKEKQKCTSAVSLDKTDDTMIDPQHKNLNVVSNDNICEEPTTKLNNLGSSSSLDFMKERDDVEIYKNDHKFSQIDKVQASSTITTCSEEQINFEKRINAFNFEENVENSRKHVNDLFEDKKEVHGDKTNNVMDFSHRQHDKSGMDRKKYDRKLHASKLRRKKYKNEITHRKRLEQSSATTVDGQAKNNKKDQIKRMLNSEIKDYVKHQQNNNEKPFIISDSVIPEQKNKTESSELCIDKIENETTTEIQTDNAPKKFSQENDDVSENIKDNCDVIKENTILPCVSVSSEDKYSKLLLKHEMDAIKQNSLSMVIDNVVTKHNEKNDEVMSTATDLRLNSPVISSNSLKDNTWNRILPFDQLESEEKLSQPNINSNEKEINTPVVSDQYDIQSKEFVNPSIDCDKNELYTPVLSNQEDKYTYPTLTNANIDCKTEEFDTPVHSVQNEKEKKDKQTHEELELIPSQNEDQYQEIQMHNSEDISLKVSSQHDAEEVVSKKKTHKKDYTKQTSRCHSYVNKELFSPRFQNLLFFNENYDICSGVLESRITKSHDLVIQDPRICATHKVGIAMNTVQRINEIGDDSDKILYSPNNTELVDKIKTPEENTEGKPDKKIDGKSKEDIYFYDNCTNADNYLKERTENEILLDKEMKPFSDIELNSHETFTNSIGGGSFDETGETIADTFQRTTKVVNSSEGEIVPEHDIRSEINYELVTGSTDDNNETNSCGTNLIVIDETTNVTPGHSNDANDHKHCKIGAPDVDNYDLDKKIQSFGRNLIGKPRFSLKRSLSDSALNTYDDNVDDCSEKKCFMLPKRKKLTDIGNIDESHLLNIIQSSRRNSISTLCNENFSFCILIDDNCLVDGENYEQENEFIEFDNNTLNTVLKDSIVEDEKSASPIYNVVEPNENNSDTYITKFDEEKSWVEDVGCEETIETEDIAENIVIGEPVSPKDTDVSDFESDDENVGILNSDVVDHTSKVKHIYGDNMCTNDAQLVDALYMTPQMDVNKKLMDRESQGTEKSTKYYDSDSLEMMLSEPINDIPYVRTVSNTDVYSSPSVHKPNTLKEDKDSSGLEVLPRLVSNLNKLLTNIDVPNEENIKSMKDVPAPIVSDKAVDGTIQSYESSLDNVFSYIHKEDCSYTSSSSPEVSSTTSEEKNSSILLKISNIKGSRTSEVKNLTFNKQKENSCKFTEKEYLNPNYNNGTSTNRPLLTKAAQKYIPPLKESIPDLKVKLTLPRQSLLKLQKNKVAKEEPKFKAHSSTYCNTSNIKPKKEIPKKVKPKFEDVLKNIDEVQFQMHKEKNKKTKKYIPKVVIKKSENGSHYASTSTKDSFNPDLTGRKWQPWVFIEKNQFIDKMALRNKTRAVFSHRRKSFVLAEKVCRYKSISSAKFIISQPKINDFAAGNLKYTIKLKQTY